MGARKEAMARAEVDNKVKRTMSKKKIAYDTDKKNMRKDEVKWGEDARSER